MDFDFLICGNGENNPHRRLRFSGADKTLSLTLFEISESEIFIRRFSPKGSVKLKARGVYNTHGNDLESKLGFYVPDENLLENFRKRLSLPK